MTSLDLTFFDVLCARHGEPFRARWPQGFPFASVKLFEAFTGLEDAKRHLEREGDSKELLRGAIDELGPLCCAVSTKTLRRVYLTCGIGQMGVCRNCANVAQGTPYRIQRGEETLEFEHICFECVLTRMAEAGKPPPPPV